MLNKQKKAEKEATRLKILNANHFNNVSMFKRNNIICSVVFERI